MLFVQEFQSKFTKKISTKKKSKNKIQGRHYLPKHLRLCNFALANHYHNIAGKGFILTDFYWRYSC